MRRIAAIALAATAFVVLALSLPATADYPPTSETPTPIATTFTPSPARTAFTGSDLTAPLVFAGILLVVGIAALYFSRRRAGIDDR